MNKRALLIGSQVHQLRGVEHDVGDVRDTLARRGFELDVRLGGRATRDGILEGYQRLIAQSGPEDVALVYYSGHGFRSRLAAEGQPRLQGIVPTDFDEVLRAGTAGISSWELSMNLERLTRKTHNVTVILDCCHSAHMSRDGERTRAQLRALPQVRHTDAIAHLAALRQRYPDAVNVLAPSWTNPHAVRMVACGADESAHEYESAGGVWRGAFTEVLCKLLRELDDGAIPWAALGRAIREHVLRHFPSQRPEIEGPLQRRLFTLLEDDGSGAVPIVRGRRGYLLRAGRLSAVSVGDLYSVLPVTSPTADAAREVARVVVLSTTATNAEVAVKEWRNGHQELPAHAMAVPRELVAARRPVAIIAPDRERAELEKQLSLTRTLRAAAPGGGATDTGLAEAPLATLRLTGDQLTIEDEGGQIFPAVGYPRGIGESVRHLVGLGVAQGIRELEGEHGLSGRAIAIELGTVVEGEARPLPDRGAILTLDDRIYVRVRSDSFQPLHVHILNLGVGGEVALLSDFTPSGIELCRGEELVLGRDELGGGQLVGQKLLWPHGVNPGQARLDELIVIVTTQPSDLRHFETGAPPLPPEWAGGPVSRGGGGQLAERLRQLQEGTTRSVMKPERERDDYFVKRMSFFLEPARRPGIYPIPGLR